MLESAQGGDGMRSSLEQSARHVHGAIQGHTWYEPRAREPASGIPPTSSWRFLDFHLASLSTETQTDPNSSFALPLAARSMCVRRVRHLSENGSQTCPKCGGNLQPAHALLHVQVCRALPRMLRAAARARPSMSRSDHVIVTGTGLPRAHDCCSVRWLLAPRRGEN